MSQDEGASTANTGFFVLERLVIAEGKGSRRGPEKEKPDVSQHLWVVVYGGL